MPGAKDIKVWLSKYFCPPETIAPQVAVGGNIPIPRKLREASIKIAVPRFTVTNTNKDGKAFGNKC